MDNKNILLLVGAVGVFWYVRNQQADKKINTTGQQLTTGGGSYTVPTQAQPVATSTPRPNTNPFSNISSLITGGTALIQQGTSAWGTIKDALHLPPATPPATPADIWAGPSTQYATA